jgi:hypothetical protein
MSVPGGTAPSMRDNARSRIAPLIDLSENRRGRRKKRPENCRCSQIDALTIAHQFNLPLKFCSRSRSSSAFATGQVKRQVRPEDA